MEISDQLLCLFSGQVEERDDRYVLEIPEREISVGTVEDGDTYRTALLSHSADGKTGATDDDQGPPAPPVSEGEQRDVEIEDIGEQGDGLTRVERGYVVIVPDTEQGERVTIEITDVQQNVAFAEVVERQIHFS